MQPAIVDAEGRFVEGAAEGNLVLLDSWPGQMRTVYGDHPRFIDTYFKAYPGLYFTGDGCRRDADGDYWITGRVDDVINVSGHRIGTAEVESALVAHPKVAEAAVVGFPHDLKGQGIYAYVTLVAEATPSDALHHELIAFVRQVIGPIATPDHLQWAPGLPKTRSGKIMRRILRKIAEAVPTRSGRNNWAIRRRWPIRRWWSRWCANVAAAGPNARQATAASGCHCAARRAGARRVARFIRCAHQMRTRSSGSRYSAWPGFGANASYHASMLRTVCARKRPGAWPSLTICARSAASRVLRAPGLREGEEEALVAGQARRSPAPACRRATSRRRRTRPPGRRGRRCSRPASARR